MLIKIDSNGHKVYLEDDGRRVFTDIYFTRYYARKAAAGNQKTVKVDGGYRNMEPDEYQKWRQQNEGVVQQL